MIIPASSFQEHLIKKCQKKQKKIVLVEGEEERILKASHYFISNDLGKVILLGDQRKIKEKIASLKLHINEDALEIIDPKESAYYEDFYKTFYELRKEKGLSLEEAKKKILEVSYFGTMLVYKGIADGMVSGAIHTTADTIRPALQIIKPLDGIKSITSLFFMLLNNKVVIYSDCAIIPTPNAEQLTEIALLSAHTAKLFDLEPKVAFLSYSSGNSGKGIEVDKIKKAVMLLREKSPDFIFDGPLQYDTAVDIEVAKRKMPNSPIKGDANVLIFPDLNSGNITYKAVQRETKSLAIGPILQGLKKPVNDLSRGSSIEDIYNTMIVTAIQSSYL